mmetsp:Transcript_43726/g.100956  ORF Transcript_43726/g.100956 Transcript_43726/m.100956 type:complete len:263 (+) Transcript_43726:733-1521(+)
MCAASYGVALVGERACYAGIPKADHGDLPVHARKLSLHLLRCKATWVSRRPSSPWSLCSAVRRNAHERHTDVSVLQSTNVIGPVTHHHGVRGAIERLHHLLLLLGRNACKNRDKRSQCCHVILREMLGRPARHTQRMGLGQALHLRARESLWNAGLWIVQQPPMQCAVVRLQHEEWLLRHVDTKCYLASRHRMVSSDHQHSVVASPKLSNRHCDLRLDGVSEGQEPTKLKIALQLLPVEAVKVPLGDFAWQFFGAKTQHSQS